MFDTCTYMHTCRVYDVDKRDVEFGFIQVIGVEELCCLKIMDMEMVPNAYRCV
jgi:hypothetical protein